MAERESGRRWLFLGFSGHDARRTYGRTYGGTYAVLAKRLFYLIAGMPRTYGRHTMADARSPRR